MAENKDGAEKTEEASIKKLQDAREKGQVAKSHDLTTAGILLIGGIMVFVLSKSMLSKLKGLFSSSLGSVGQFDFSDSNVLTLIYAMIKSLAELMLPLMILLVIIALASEISQVGLKLATKK